MNPSLLKTLFLKNVNSACHSFFLSYSLSPPLYRCCTPRSAHRSISLGESVDARVETLGIIRFAAKARNRSPTTAPMANRGVSMAQNVLRQNLTERSSARPAGSAQQDSFDQIE